MALKDKTLFITGPSRGTTEERFGGIAIVDPSPSNVSNWRRTMKVLEHTRKILAVALLALGTLVSQADDAVASYPDKLIKFIVPFPAGSGSDLTARLVAHALSAKTGQPVIVENKPGASGFIGAQAAAGAKPDGYTVLSPRTPLMPPTRRCSRRCPMTPCATSSRSA